MSVDDSANLQAIKKLRSKLENKVRSLFPTIITDLPHKNRFVLIVQPKIQIGARSHTAYLFAQTARLYTEA